MKKKNLFYSFLILPMLFGLGLSGISASNDTNHQIDRKAEAYEGTYTKEKVDFASLWNSLETRTGKDAQFHFFNIDGTKLPISETAPQIEIAHGNPNSYREAYIRNYNNKNTDYYLRLENKDTEGTADGYGCAITVTSKPGYGIAGFDILTRSNMPEGSQVATIGGEQIQITSSDNGSHVQYLFDQLETEFTFGTKLMSSSYYYEITQLRVYWTAVESYVLSFDTGCAVEIEDQVFLKGNNTVSVKPADPVRPTEGSTKYTFAGWYTDKTYTTEFVFGTTITENTTVYAKWDEETISGYTVSFNLMGGTGDVPSQTVVPGGTATVPVAVPTKAADARYSYEFVCWCGEESLTKAFDFENTPITEDTTLYAYYDYNIAAYDGETVASMKKENFYKDLFAAWTASADITLTGLNSRMPDSSMHIESNNQYSSNAGIRAPSSWDVQIRYANVTWEIHDYSKYIDTFRLEIKNTEYNNYGLGKVDLYKGSVISDATLVDSEARPSNDPTDPLGKTADSETIIQMLGNTDETVRTVTFVEREGRYFGWESLRYILKDASVEQQHINFARDFLNTITCDGVGSVTSSKEAWNAIAAKVEKYLTGEVVEAISETAATNAEVRAALDRYTLIVTKYGKEEYSDFLNLADSIGLNFNRLFPMSVENSLSMVAVLVIALITIIAACAYAGRRKAKR